MRVGVALPVVVNLPFDLVAAAALRLNHDGTGDIPLTLTGAQRLAYAVLWPHVRPGRVRQPEPMLRAVPDAARVADLLSEALGAALERGAASVAPGSDDVASRTTWQPVTAAA